MKRITGIAVALALFSCPVTLADEASERQAGLLLDSLDMKTAFDHTIQAMLDFELQKNPTLRPYRGVMMEFFQTYMGYESMLPDLIKIYGDAFTADELRQLTDFYSTPVGQKSIQVMPHLMAEGSRLGERRVMENLDELERMIADESARIQSLQQSETP